MTKRYTPEAKSELNRLFIKDYLDGLTVTEIAEKHNVSKASIYRWKRQQNQDIKELSVFANFDIEIEKALSIIDQHQIVNLWVLRDAIFRIAVWIRWPSQPHNQRAMLITCACNYLRQSKLSSNLHDLEIEELNFLYKYVDLDFLSSIATPDAPFFEFFNIQTYGKSRYTDLDFFASITRYLLSQRALRGLHKKTANLDKLHYLIEREVFGPGWVMSKRTFQAIWSARAATFPFLYVERFAEIDQNIDWGFEPQAPEFSKDFDFIVANAEYVKRYLEHCRWTIEALQSRLHPLSAQHIQFPRFPVGIESVPPKVRPYDAAEIAKLEAAGG